MTVYLDMVFLLNFTVDLLLLLGTNRLSGFPPALGRAALASGVGAFYGAACLIPGFSFLGNFLWQSVSFAFMALIAFGMNRSIFQRAGLFLLLTFALGGLAMGVGKGRFLSVFLCGGLLWLLCRVGFRGSTERKTYIPVQLFHNGRSLSLIALQDTGNTLTDPLTGEQVLVAGSDVGMELLGLSEAELANPADTLASGRYRALRLIPYRSVGQPSGMMLAARFHQAKIGDTYRDPLVAFAPEEIGRGEVYRMLTGGAI